MADREDPKVHAARLMTPQQKLMAFVGSIGLLIATAYVATRTQHRRLTESMLCRGCDRTNFANGDPLNYVVPPTPLVGNEPRVFDPTRYAKYTPYDSRKLEAQLHDGAVQPNTTPYYYECLCKNFDTTWKQDPYQKSIDLLNWMLLEPVVAINESCKPPPLPDPARIDCKAAFPHAGFSTRREKPRKLGIAIQYGFEVDVLELYLSEVYEMVDKIFLCESIKAHRENAPKLLMWEHLKHQPRFKKYQDKVVHLIVDDTELAQRGNGLFRNEHNQEMQRFKKLKKWNQMSQYFQDEDLIGFGDADEIPLRSTLQYLKYCDLESLDKPIDIGSWLLEQMLRQSFKSDWPVDNIAHSLGDPTFHSVRSVMRSSYLTRNKGRSGHYMLGGMHYSSQFYSPFVLMKMTHCTECNGANINNVDNYQSLLTSTSTYTATKGRKAYCVDKRGKLGVLEQYPWLLMCNPERYKSVYGYLDDRLFLTREQVPFRCAHDHHH